MVLSCFVDFHSRLLKIYCRSWMSFSLSMEVMWEVSDCLMALDFFFFWKKWFITWNNDWKQKTFITEVSKFIFSSYQVVVLVELFLVLSTTPLILHLIPSFLSIMSSLIWLAIPANSSSSASLPPKTKAKLLCFWAIDYMRKSKPKTPNLSNSWRRRRWFTPECWQMNPNVMANFSEVGNKPLKPKIKPKLVLELWQQAQKRLPGCQMVRWKFKVCLWILFEWILGGNLWMVNGMIDGCW